MKKNKKNEQDARDCKVVRVADECGSRTYLCDDEQCRPVQYCECSCCDCC